MAIPKNKRRTIVVNKIDYQYAITGGYNYNSIFIKNMINGQTFSAIYDFPHDENNSNNGGYVRTRLNPVDVRKIIIKNKI